MVTKVKTPRTLVTGRVAPTTGAEDVGELSVNIPDRKIFIRDAAGVPRMISQGIVGHSDALVYRAGDIVIYQNRLYVSAVNIPAPGPFDADDWVFLGDNADVALDGAVILGPQTEGRNKVITAPGASGLIIEGATAQTADLLVVEGTAQSDLGRWAIDALGFPNSRAGAVVWRQQEPNHTFTARGQPAAFNGTRWVLAEADAANGAALALVQEIIDANTIVLRSGGRITNLQTGAFAGGVITPGTRYYVSATVPGQLTLVEPTEGRRDAVLTTVSTTSGVVTTGTSRLLSETAPPTKVGPTPPSNPAAGQFWYRTVAPAGLFMWFIDADSAQWVQVAGSGAGGADGGLGVEVGDTPPKNPEQGQLWYSTVAPVGLFTWYDDPSNPRWLASGDFLPLAGGTLTGSLTLPGAPTADLHAATKKYVDDTAAGIQPPPATHVGDTPPATPEQGQLWFRTVDPVGLFVWYVDADSSQWVQVGGGGGGDGTVPVGTVMFFAAPVPPTGWLECNHQRVTTAHAQLRQFLIDAGSPYGTLNGDPRVPELRGEFIRGHIGARTGGVDDGRVFGSWQEDDFKSHIHAFGNGGVAGGGFASLTNGRGSDTATSATGGTETRPRNVALLPCIKAFDSIDVAASAPYVIASTNDVRDGNSNAHLLTPANVRALSGLVSSGSLAGLSEYTFANIPSQFTEADLLFSGIGGGAGTSIGMTVTMNGLETGYNAQSQVHGAAYAAPVGYSNGFVIPQPVSGGSFYGLIRMSQNSNNWMLDGSLRAGGTTRVCVLGQSPTGVVPLSALRFLFTGPLTSGVLRVRWRI